MTRESIFWAVIFFLGVLYLIKRNKAYSYEGFAEKNGRCGVDLPTCPVGTKCMNGYCLVDAPPKQAENDFIVLPQ